MISPFLMGRPAGGNDSYALVFNQDMHNKQQAAGGVIADDRVTRLVVAPGIHQAKERIKKSRRRLPERDPVMFARIGFRFFRAPHEGGAVEFKADVHEPDSRIRIYFVNT